MIKAFIFGCSFLTLCIIQAMSPLPVCADDVETMKGNLHIRGGIFGAGHKHMENTGAITGHGVFLGKRLTNKGSMRLNGGPSTLECIVENVGDMELAHDRAVFNRNVINHGKMKITDTHVTFNGSYTENGEYFSDPSSTYHNDLIVGATGFLRGGVGDNWYINGDFTSTSAMNTSWDTVDCYLEFRVGPSHEFHITGTDSGVTTTGYTENFSWDTLNIASSNSITLFDGNATPTGALYVNVIQGVQTSGSTITNISVNSGDDLNIYYQPSEAENAYLSASTYDFSGPGSGQLIPLIETTIPTVSEWGMLVMALLLVTGGAVVMRRRSEVR